MTCRLDLYRRLRLEETTRTGVSLEKSADCWGGLGPQPGGIADYGTYFGKSGDCWAEFGRTCQSWVGFWKIFRRLGHWEDLPILGLTQEDFGKSGDSEDGLELGLGGITDNALGFGNVVLLATGLELGTGARKLLGLLWNSTRKRSRANRL